MKAFFRTEARRFSFDGTFADLLQQVVTRFNLPLESHRLRLKFKDDDDDLITLSTDEECLEAIRISTSLAAPVLKIYIEVHTEEPRVRHDTEDVV